MLLYLIKASLFIPGNAFALFIPTIINELGYASTTAQLLSIPPYVLAVAVTLVLGTLSDKHQIRGPFIIGCAVFGIAGFSILYASSTAALSYSGTMLAASGVFPTVPISLAWNGGNSGGETKRGVAIGLMIGVGTFGGYEAMTDCNYG